MSDRFAKAEPGDLVAMVCRPLAADFDQPQVGHDRADCGEYVEQHVDPLPRDTAPDVEQPGPSIDLGKPRQLYGGLGTSRGELQCDSEGSVDQPIGVDQAYSLDLCRNGGRIVEDNRRLLEACQNALGHRPEPPRPWVGNAVEQATKVIQVVTVNPGPACGQGVHKLAIGVIGDMEQVEQSHGPASVVGEDEEPIQEPIGVERRMPAANGR